MDDRTLSALTKMMAEEDLATRRAVGVLLAGLFDLLASKGALGRDELKALLFYPAGSEPDQSFPLSEPLSEEARMLRAVRTVAGRIRAELGIPD